MQGLQSRPSVCISCRLAVLNHSQRTIQTGRRSFSISAPALRVESRKSRPRRDDDLPFRVHRHATNKGFLHRDERQGYNDSNSGYKGARPYKGSSHEVADFQEVVGKSIRVVEKELRSAPIVEQLAKDGSSFEHEWETFRRRATSGSGTLRSVELTSIHRALRTAFRDRGAAGVEDTLKYGFYGAVTGSRFTASDIENQKDMADLRYPTEWYPATRVTPRSIHLHVGPTNSGKTYHALKRLESAETGLYAGPLRLLAHEVFTRLNAKGKPCALVTGEERRAAPDRPPTLEMMSCTVEMIPLNKTFDVAVIDEIQMIGNVERGWAWTQALLGIKAKELHLCGEARTVSLIKEICASIGETVHVHEYTRLSPLELSENSLDGDFKKLRKGDCIVSFSVVGIHAMRRQIEKASGKKVAIVYGSLPPETRAQQARLFNDPNNDYDFLVASDAIGMGLNLSIKRIIFESVERFDGTRRNRLPVADIKQIAGRAGRYRSAFQDNNKATQAAQDLSAAKGETAIDAQSTLEPASAHVDLTAVSTPHQEEALDDQSVDENVVLGPATSITELAKSFESRPPPNTSKDNVGLVTTMEKYDFPIVADALVNEPEPIKTAGILPPGPIVERFAQYFPPATPFSFVLLRLHEIAKTHSRFHLCRLRDQLWLADLIESVRGLTTSDRIIFCACPASSKDKDMYKDLMPAFARCVEQQKGGDLWDIAEIPLEVLEQEASPNRNYLRDLEKLHQAVISYLWLSYRFAGIFSTRPLAFHVKELVEVKIEQVLAGITFTEKARQKIVAARQGQWSMTNKIGWDPNAIPDELKEEHNDEAVDDGETSLAQQDDGAKTNKEAGSTVWDDERYPNEEDIPLVDPTDQRDTDDTDWDTSKPDAQLAAEIMEQSSKDIESDRGDDKIDSSSAAPDEASSSPSAGGEDTLTGQLPSDNDTGAPPRTSQEAGHRSEHAGQSTATRTVPDTSSSRPASSLFPKHPHEITITP